MLEDQVLSADPGLRETDQPALLGAGDGQVGLDPGHEILRHEGLELQLGSVGLSAYQGSAGNEGSMTVRLYWFCALAAAIVPIPSP